jgi:hypothetical protein
VRNCINGFRAYLASTGNKAAEELSKKSSATREQLVSAAQDAYNSASATGGNAFASVTSYLAKQTDAAKDSVFDTWSESELKNYLDSYGFQVPQGSTKNELIAWARNQRNWFKYGTTTPQGTLWVKLYVFLFFFPATCGMLELGKCIDADDMISQTKRSSMGHGPSLHRCSSRPQASQLSS